MKKYVISKKQYVIVILLVLLIFVSFRSYNYFSHRNVIGCSNSHVSTSFEKWCDKELNADYVPVYIIIKNGRVTNLQTGITTSFDFKKLRRTDRLDKPVLKEKIQDLNGKKYSLDEFDVIEVVMLDCPACKEQQKKYSSEIHSKNHLKFLTFYVFSTSKEVKKDLNNNGI